METLEKIFGSVDRVRIMRMFLFNPDVIYGVDQISLRTGAARRVVDREVALLQKAELVRRKPFPRISKDQNGNKRRGSGWTLNKNFKYLKPLENLLIQQVLISEPELLARFNRVGKVRLLVIAGIFIQSDESRVDLLLVFDKLRKKKLQEIMRAVEADIGKEVRYAAFEAPEFDYRVRMYDKLVRDIFDYPHKKILDKMSVDIPK